MEIYYLFRGDEVVYSNQDNLSGHLGAGEAHAKGQAGDVLICTNRGTIRAWHWNMPHSQSPKDELPWMDIPDKDLDHAKYKVLIMLQS
jgi:hypothetical protein